MEDKMEMEPDGKGRWMAGHGRKDSEVKGRKGIYWFCADEIERNLSS